MWQPNILGIKSLRGNALVTAYMVCCGIAFTMFGYDQAVVGALSNNPSLLHHMGVIKTDPLIVGCIVAIFSVGAIFGSAVTMLIGYRTGRRWLIFIGCLFLVIGAALQATSFSLAQMIAGRLIAGFGVGFVSCTIPLLASEIAKPNRRGILIAALFTLAVVSAMAKCSNDEFIWRFPAAFQGFFGTFTAVWFPNRYQLAFQRCAKSQTQATIFLLPESPRWLYARGYVEAANNVLARVYDQTEHSELIQATYAALKAEVDDEEKREEKGFRLFTQCIKAMFWDTTDLKLGRRLRLCFLVMMLQEMSGLNVIVPYTNNLFEIDLKFDALKSIMIAAIIQVAWAAFTTCGMLTIERWGRRPTLMIGTTICTLGMTGFTISIAIGSESAGWAGMVMLIVFFFGFAFGMLPMSWLYPSEILPLHMRHVGLGVAGITTWLFTFLTVFTGPISFTATGYKIFILYIIFNALVFPYAYFLMVETKDKTLEEVNLAFSPVAAASILGPQVMARTHDEKDQMSGQVVEKEW
ncbi:uncharacterized protein A1O5_11752 [Cladophialophora psammophila CBS 110553]|uniref:Major facilitator superfamily (MFS) profile domain-containing protein n=1 Tax=Cladophialophora psammophila CBS 110553 TaxID=1182543 RepID=W9WA78_9EURO|nr:uncharacterized protein A1O5_11752 [Cladophialophora psammophila CBS 110553]EXJ61436.1 hypothetical protein A1O5_11752 [Cladophialophora psammophila CBS 110553]